MDTERTFWFVIRKKILVLAAVFAAAPLIGAAASAGSLDKNKSDAADMVNVPN